MDSPTIFINGAIGDGAENTAERLGNFMAAHAGQSITVAVNSPGGDAHEGAAMMALVEQHGDVTCQIVGLAASAASLIPLPAKRIMMHATAHIMIHEPGSVIFGTATELRTEADVLDKLTATYAEAYARATGHPVKRILAWMEAETWLTASEALALNFCDEIFGEGERSRPVAAFDYTRFRHAPEKLLRATARNHWNASSDEVL